MTGEVGGGVNLEATVGVLIGRAGEQEAAQAEVLSIRGIGDVLRSASQVWQPMAETVCLQAHLVWSAQRASRHAHMESLVSSVPPSHC